MSASSLSSRFLKSSKTTSALVGNVIVREHIFSFPLDWQEVDHPTAIKIDVFVRELASSTSVTSDPALLFLQGGPGFPSPRPTTPITGWMKVALEKGHRVLLMDQRGTGASTAMSVQRLVHLEEQGGVELQAHYLSHMRSDEIADDVEGIRAVLCGKDGKISLLGQSFGGFCMLSYLSRHSANMSKGYFTVGLAPVTRCVTEVYTATYRRMLVRNHRYYQRYPQDILHVKQIVSYLNHRETTTGPVVLPRGGWLTVRRFLQLGHMLGSGSGMDNLHHLLEGAWFSQDGIHEKNSVLSDSFLHSIEEEQYGFEYSPIYWLLHESIYMNNNNRSSSSSSSQASAWAAERVMGSDEFKDAFNPLRALDRAESHVNFTGEMVYSWMGEDYAALRPLQKVAAVLAEKIWDRPLYDLTSIKDVAKRVPCAALVSYDDVYVERVYSEETAELLGGVDHCKLWVTNEFQHSGLRDDPVKVLETLFKMNNHEAGIPS